MRTKIPPGNPGGFSFSILHFNVFSPDQRIANQRRSIQFLPVHIHRGDLVIVVGLVIINALIRIAAGGIQSDLISPLPQPAAATGLADGTQNVKKLADAFRL